MDIDAMIAEAVIAAELESGVNARSVVVAHKDYAGRVQALAPVLATSTRPPRWTREEEAQLAEELGQFSLEEIARKHGRTPAAIKIRFTRKGLAAPSKKPDEYTCQQIAEMLGKDAKSMAKIIDRGILPGRELPLATKIRVVKRVTFYRWVIRPESWVYFKVENITDPSLKRLVELAQAKWDDEWLNIRAAAMLIGHTHSHLLNKWLNDGRIQHPDAIQWGNWWIRRSVMLDTSWRNSTNNGKLNMIGWSKSGDAFIVLAHAVGLSYREINTLRGCSKEHRDTGGRLVELRKKDAIAPLIADYHLQVQVQEGGCVWADWRMYKHRFPRLERTVRRFLAGETLNRRDLNYVRGIMWSWARWFVPDEPLTGLIMIGGTITRARLWDYYQQLKQMGIDPFELGEADAAHQTY